MEKNNIFPFIALFANIDHWLYICKNGKERGGEGLTSSYVIYNTQAREKTTKTIHTPTYSISWTTTNQAVKERKNKRKVLKCWHLFYLCVYVVYIYGIVSLYSWENETMKEETFTKFLAFYFFLHVVLSS